MRPTTPSHHLEQLDPDELRRQHARREQDREDLGVPFRAGRADIGDWAGHAVRAKARNWCWTLRLRGPTATGGRGVTALVVSLLVAAQASVL